MDAERKNRVKSFLMRIGIVLVSFGLYTGLALQFSGNVEVLYLVLIPIALSGAFFGLPGGIAGAVFGFLLSELLYRAAFARFVDYTTALWIIESTVVIFIGGLVGYLGGLIGKQKKLIERLKTTVENKGILFQASEKAHGRARFLSGLVAACGYCKKIRIDEDKWQGIEAFIRDNSDLEFSHSICPDCLQVVLKDLAKHEE